MEFRDAALDENGQRRQDQAVGALFVSEDGAWRLGASDPVRPDASEWYVWQHVDRAAPLNDRDAWVRRLPWVRLPLVEHARVVAVALSALPANASWEVARVRVRDALRDVGAAVFFRSMHAANVAMSSLAARLRARTGATTDDLADDGQDAGA